MKFCSDSPVIPILCYLNSTSFFSTLSLLMQLIHKGSIPSWLNPLFWVKVRQNIIAEQAHFWLLTYGVNEEEGKEGSEKMRENG